MKVSWDDDIPNIWKNKFMFQTTNQMMFLQNYTDSKHAQHVLTNIGLRFWSKINDHCSKLSTNLLNINNCDLLKGWLHPSKRGNQRIAQSCSTNWLQTRQSTYSSPPKIETSNPTSSSKKQFHKQEMSGFPEPLKKKKKLSGRQQIWESTKRRWTWLL